MATVGLRIDWSGLSQLAARAYTCGWCGREIASERGWQGQLQALDEKARAVQILPQMYWMFVCPRCYQPTLFDHEQRQTPGVPFGDPVDHLPDDIERLYAEARRCMAQSAFTAAAMIGRKLLMNIAVTKGAPEGGSYKSYVNYLAGQGIVTGEMTAWIDEIRELGNDANHELPDISQDEAEALLTFIAMLLKIVYEFPERGRLSVEARKAKQSAQGGA